jgi:hypothetical protein
MCETELYILLRATQRILFLKGRNLLGYSQLNGPEIWCVQHIREVCERAHMRLAIDLHPLAIEDVLNSPQISMSKADYYSKHLFISALLHKVENPASPNMSILSADSSRPEEAPTLIPGSTMPLTATPGRMAYSHSMSELPQPATASKSDGVRPNWLRSRFSGRVKDYKPIISDSHFQHDEVPPPDNTGDDSVNWISGSIEVSEGNEEAARNRDGMVERENGAEEEENYLTQARRRAASLAFVNELKGEDRVLLDVTNLISSCFGMASIWMISFNHLMFVIHIASGCLGTVITIYKKAVDGHVFAAPILRRLRSMHTLLRRSSDPSLLLQAILDFGE